MLAYLWFTRRRRKALQRLMRRSRIRCLRRATGGVRALLDDLERETHFLPL